MTRLPIPPGPTCTTTPNATEISHEFACGTASSEEREPNEEQPGRQSRVKVTEETGPAPPRRKAPTRHRRPKSPFAFAFTVAFAFDGRLPRNDGHE